MISNQKHTCAIINGKIWQNSKKLIPETGRHEFHFSCTELSFGSREKKGEKKSAKMSVERKSNKGLK